MFFEVWGLLNLKILRRWVLGFKLPTWTGVVCINPGHTVRPVGFSFTVDRVLCSPNNCGAPSLSSALWVLGLSGRSMTLITGRRTVTLYTVLRCFPPFTYKQLCCDAWNREKRILHFLCVVCFFQNSVCVCVHHSTVDTTTCSFVIWGRKSVRPEIFLDHLNRKQNTLLAPVKY